MREDSPNSASSSSLEEYCLSSDSSSSLEEYCLSTDLTSSLEEYCLSTDSSSSLEEYYLRSASPKRLKANETSEEFSIEEYDINKDTDNEEVSMKQRRPWGMRKTLNLIVTRLPQLCTKRNLEALCILEESHGEFVWPDLT